jgi:serine/threonine protein kinase
LAFEQGAKSFIEAPALEETARGIAAPPASSSVTGEISHYQIRSRLGEGGMGMVYKAMDMRRDRVVASKVGNKDNFGTTEEKQ